MGVEEKNPGCDVKAAFCMTDTQASEKGWGQGVPWSLQFINLQVPEVRLDTLDPVLFTAPPGGQTEHSQVQISTIIDRYAARTCERKCRSSTPSLWFSLVLFFLCKISSPFRENNNVFPFPSHIFMPFANLWFIPISRIVSHLKDKKLPWPLPAHLSSGKAVDTW